MSDRFGLGSLIDGMIFLIVFILPLGIYGLYSLIVKYGDKDVFLYGCPVLIVLGFVKNKLLR